MIKFDIRVPVGYTVEDMKEAALSHIPISADEFKDATILKRALDLKDKKDIHYKMTVALSLDKDREAGLLKMRKKACICGAFCI